MCLAIPGKIVALLDGDRDTGMVEVLGVRRKVDLGLLQDDPSVAGDWVLIHVGFAMSKIGEAEALEQSRMLTSLGEAEAATEEVRGYGWARRKKPIALVPKVNMRYVDEFREPELITRTAGEYSAAVRSRAPLPLHGSMRRAGEYRIRSSRIEDSPALRK